MRTAVKTLVVFVLASASCLHADSILSTYCGVDLPDGGVSEVNSTAACSVVVPVPPFTVPAFAEASATSSYEAAIDWSEPDLIGTFWAHVGVGTQANHPPFDRELLFYPESSTAYALAELNFQATTAGPVRPGLVDLTYFWNRAFGGNNDLHAEVRIGDVFAELLDANGTCQGSCGGGTFPFVLGQPFEIHLSSFAQSWGNWHSGGDSGTSVDAYFRMRELDGTPVDLLLLGPEAPAPVPEPSTLWLLASALLLLALRQAMKTSGRLVRHARYDWLPLTEVHLNRKLFSDMLNRR